MYFGWKSFLIKAHIIRVSLFIRKRGYGVLVENKLFKTSTKFLQESGTYSLMSNNNVLRIIEWLKLDIKIGYYHKNTF